MDRGDTECPDKHSGDDPKHAQLPGGGLAVQPCLAIDEEQSDCCVCYNGLTHPCMTSCKHVFCHSCITRCMRTTRPYSRGRCPVCRGSISLYSVTDMNTGTALKEPLVQTIYGSTYSYDGDPRRIELGAFEFGSSALECFFVVAKAYLAAEYGLVTRVRYGGGSGAVGRFLLENVSWDADTRRLSATHTWENMTANAKDEENATDISPPQTVWEFDVVFAMGLETTECAHITSHVCDGTSGDDAVDRSEQNTTHTSSSHTHTHRDTDRIHSSTTETDTNQVLPERAHTHTHTVVGGKGRCRGRCRGRARATALHLDHLYRLRDPPSTIWGCVYGQFDTIGMASYHFDHPGAEGSYISYEEAPAAWQLDDGSRPPHRKLFLDPVYDSDRKVFTATVEWDTGFNGDTKWEYTIAFADDFRTVVAGAVERYGLDGKLIGETLFNQQLYYRLCYDEM